MNQHTTDSSVEDLFLSDPFPARAIALESAARVGVPAEALQVLREMTDGAELTAQDWTRRALDLGAKWAREAA
jgi:hypothetical protein